MAGIDPKAPDELLLVELAGGAAALALQVNVAANLLAQLLPRVLDDTRRAIAVARVLGELAAVGTTLVRRVEGTLSTAATLRLQRRPHDRTAK